MSAALTTALARGGRRRRSLAWRAAGGVAAAEGSGGAASLLSMSHGTDTVLAQLTGNQALNNHREQERHLTGWVFSCVRAIAQRIAGQPLRVARMLDRGSAPGTPAAGSAGGRPLAHKDFVPLHLKQTAVQGRIQLLDDHPIMDTLERPNAVMTRWALSFTTGASLETTGKAYWWVYRGDAASPTPWTILPLPASWVRPLHEEGGLFTGWMVRAGGGGRELPVPADEIIYIHYPDPSNPLGALAPLQAVARAVVADEAISEAQRRTFTNGIYAGYAITVGRNLDADGKPTGERPRLTRAQRNQIIAAVLTAYRGVLNYDHPIILDGLIESISKISNSPREMDFLKSKGITKEEISQGFGVNPIILGQVENANRASAATADDLFCQNTINPKLELISQILTAFLAPRFAAAGERLLLYYEPAHAYDPDLEMNRQKFLMTNAGMTINELRQALGLQPEPGGDVALLPATVAPYDLSTPYDFEAAAAAAPPAGGGPPAHGGGVDAQDRVDSGDRGADNQEGGGKSAGRFPALGYAGPRAW